VVTKVKLHNPTQAIDLLNKMGGDYPQGEGTTINFNEIKIVVVEAPAMIEAKDATE